MTAKKRARIAPRPGGEVRRNKRYQDVAIVHGATEDGEGARILRFKGGAVFAGEIRPVREGRPIADRELVRLRPLHETLPICEVETIYSADPPRRETSGPARVTSPDYRRNWSVVFGGAKKRAADLPN